MENFQTVPHHISEDCWFSCPKSAEGCCNPETPKNKCTCRADEYNAWLGELRAQRESLIKELEAAAEDKIKMLEALKYYEELLANKS